MRRLLTRWHGREEGQGLVEYGLLLLLVSIVVVSALTSMGNVVVDVLLQPATQMF